MSKGWSAPMLHCLWLCILFVIVGLGTIALVLGLGLFRAGDDVIDTLEARAEGEAVRLREQIERALDLGMTIAEIRMASEYFEEIAKTDPAIRFITLTDGSLVRLHYGGIGRRRLDPMLSDKSLAAISENLRPLELAHQTVGEFSLSVTPIFHNEAREGYLIVAVQAKQVREALQSKLFGIWPIFLAAALFLIELALWQGRRSLISPLSQLFGLASNFVHDDIRQALRRDEHELGKALKNYNGILYRLGHRVEGMREYFEDVGRAVFDPEIRKKVESRAENFDATLAGSWRRADWDPNDRPALALEDLHMPVFLAFALTAWIFAAPILNGDLRTIGIGLAAFAATSAIGSLRLPALAGIAIGFVSIGFAWWSWPNNSIAGALFCGIGTGVLASQALYLSKWTPAVLWLTFRAFLGGMTGGILGWQLAPPFAAFEGEFYVAMAGCFALAMAVWSAPSLEALVRRPTKAGGQ